MTKAPKEPDVSKTMDLWVASDLKIQSLMFFHDNPGVIETLEGLAKRLGTNAQSLRKDIADHITLGIIQERKTSGYTLLVFDRQRENDVQGVIEERIRSLKETAGGRAA